MSNELHIDYDSDNEKNDETYQPSPSKKLKSKKTLTLPRGRAKGLWNVQSQSQNRNELNVFRGHSRRRSIVRSQEFGNRNEMIESHRQTVQKWNEEELEHQPNTVEKRTPKKMPLLSGGKM